MAKLTKRSADRMANPLEGQAFLWHDELRGCVIRAISTGLKVFVLQYRDEEGRRRRIFLARFGVLTVEQARWQATDKATACNRTEHIRKLGFPVGSSSTPKMDASYSANAAPIFSSL